MNSFKKNMFEGSIYEQAYKELQELEDYEKIYNRKTTKKVLCPKNLCNKPVSSRSTLRNHVKLKHASDYNRLQGLSLSDDEEQFSSAPFHDMIEDAQNNDLVNDNQNAASIFDPARILSTSTESDSNSTFLNLIRRNFSKNFQEKAFSMFNTIIELRYGEALAESTYARISSEIIEKCLSLFAEELSPQSLQLIEQIKRFASSLYLQKVYIKSLGGLIEPITVPIGTILEYQYISIKQVAESVLSTSLVNQIIHEQSLPFQFSDYSSELTCEHSRWQSIRGRLRMQLYSDEFSIANPIGHSRNLQNYLVIYCSFTNIPFKNRLKRNDIFLLLIVNHKNITADVLSSVLEKLQIELDELLFTGINKTIDNGQIINVPCALSSLVGDAKSAYQLLGYRSSFGLYFRCRFCGASHNEIQSGILNKALLGSQSDVTDYWRLVDRTHGLEFSPEDETATRLGLIRKFQFASKSPSRPVDPWSICPPDVCHDILEGTLPTFVSISLSEITRLFLKNKEQMVTIVTSKQFYDSPFSIRSITGGFSIDGDMIQRAELLIRLEQILLEDLPSVSGIPALLIQDSEPFLFYMAFKEICIICFKTTISDNDLEQLSNLITKMFRYFMNFNFDPPLSVTPKMHHISHYPQLIRKFGPLIFYSSLPYERKHQSFKQWARLMHNNINPALSLAVRHMCHQAISRTFSQANLEFDAHLNSNPVILATLPSDSIYCSSPTNCQLNKSVLRRIGTSNNWIEVKSFWKIESSNTIIVGGTVFERTELFKYTFPILMHKHDYMYISLSDLYHVNDFCHRIEDSFVLITGII